MARYKHIDTNPRFHAVDLQRRRLHGMAIFCKPFTKMQIRYFDHAKTAEARKWLSEP